MAATKSKSKSQPKPKAEENVDLPLPPETVAPPNEKVDGKDVTKLDTGLDDLEIIQHDGATAVFRLGSEERVVDQAALHSAAKKIAKGVQQTY